jgi:uncharacterized protein YcnI
MKEVVPMGNGRGVRSRLAIALALCGLLALAFAALASAHARVSPPVSLTGKLQLYSLAVPTEKDRVTTTKVVLSVPAGFSIDSFVAAPGWHRSEQQSGSGQNAVVTQVTWTGGRTPTGEDSLFQFLAQPASSTTYAFKVQQTYSDGSIVNWTGPESGESPAPTIQAQSSLGGGGGGTPTLSIVALILAALALAAGGLALASRSGRPLA